MQTCWDADRLDLGRVGIWPDPRKLCTDQARHKPTIVWALERSQQGFVPGAKPQAWIVRLRFRASSEWITASRN